MKKLLLSLMMLLPFVLNASSIDITTIMESGKSKVIHVPDMNFVRFEYSNIPDQQQPKYPANYHKTVLYYDDRNKLVDDVINIAESMYQNGAQTELNMHSEEDCTIIIGNIKAYLIK